MRERLLSTAVALAISAAALWWLLSGADLRALLVLAREAHVWQLLLAALLLPLVQWLRAWRFSLLLSGRAALPSWRLVDIAVRLLVFNYLLPFKLGELSFPVMMRQAFGTEYTRSAGVLVLARLMDLGVVGALLFLAAAVVLPAAAPPAWSAPLLLLAALACAAMPILAVTVAGPMRRAASRLERARSLVERLLWGVQMVSAPGQRALAMALTALLWSLHLTVAWLAASAVYAALPFAAIAMASAASHLAFALPVPSVIGLGPPQAAWSTALHLADVPWNPAILTALVAHAVQLSGALLLGLVVFLARIWRPALPEARPWPSGTP